ncbi:MAG TPA: lactate 2-monooxygenase [Terriglobia bacterium]|nr:lactate 2-monooxygenase [Terriglobia bacterium]
MENAAAPRSYGIDRQMQIYQSGVTGAKPAVPADLARLERKAKESLSPEAYDYIAGGAGGEDTMRANLAAFAHWRIVPRMLRNVSVRDLRVKLLGLELPAPVLLAPIGVQGIVHREAELAAARAAASVGIPFVLSTASSRTIEQVAGVMGDAPRWFQLYWSKDSEITASMVRRAERTGYKAIVVTLDTALLGWRERDLEYPYLPFLSGEGLANYFSDPAFRAQLAKPPEQDPVAAVRHWLSIYSNTALTWDDLGGLRRHTSLPILLKGILHADDAAEAVRGGVDGIIVSNHGGRQVDGAIAALDALPLVVRSVGGRIPVLVDSGIRRGSDALKAVALGARAVLLGRPYLWGLAVAGEQGVREVLLNFLADFDLALALSGYTSCDQLNESALVRTES